MAALWFALCLVQSLVVCASSLRWHNISNATDVGALCNDFSAAGYFIRKNVSSSDWIVFLEGGGGCSSPASCNERFIDSAVRKRYTSVVNGTKAVDVERAWNDSLSDPLAVTSKLMTSLWRFWGAGLGDWEIEGTDILSLSASSNPQFSTYNHVLIPYCSSDLWLLDTNDFVKAQKSDFRFSFNPTSPASQFTFRGVSILRGVVRDLFALHGLHKATTVLFAGSSGGGVGVLNHAHWLKEQLDYHTSLSSRLFVMADSSWFINFHGNLEKRASFGNISHLAETAQILPSCAADPLDPTSCVSAPSILTTPDLFPSDVPLLAILSVYDLYFLQDSLIQTKAGAYLDLLRVVAEYGGSMNESLQGVGRGFPGLSYYVTSCFQHTYLATSSLWGGKGSLFGDAAIGGEIDNNKFV